MNIALYYVNLQCNFTTSYAEKSSQKTRSTKIDVVQHQKALARVEIFQHSSVGFVESRRLQIGTR